jgi:S-(hydroxymethyl)glutathione dehydrogenase/alcohol dehydrogenase
VEGLAAGDSVVLHTLAACGRCRFCASGRPTWCRATFGNRRERFTLGGAPCSDFAATSTFVERTVVSAGQAVVIPKDVPPSSACLIGCAVITGVGAVLNRARVRAGESAAVFGIGGVGLNVLQGLRIAGAARVVAVDTNPAKKADALRFGASDFVVAEPQPGRAAEAVRDVLGGADGVDWSFECAGAPAALAEAVDVLTWGGNCVVVGVPSADAKLDVRITHLTHVDRGILGCRYGSAQPHRDIPRFVEDYRAGRLLLDELVTQTYPLEEFDAAVAALRAGELARGVLSF